MILLFCLLCTRSPNPTDTSHRDKLSMSYLKQKIVSAFFLTSELLKNGSIYKKTGSLEPAHPFLLGRWDSNPRPIGYT